MPDARYVFGLQKKLLREYRHVHAMWLELSTTQIGSCNLCKNELCNEQTFKDISAIVPQLSGIPPRELDSRIDPCKRSASNQKSVSP